MTGFVRSMLISGCLALVTIALCGIGLSGFSRSANAMDPRAAERSQLETISSAWLADGTRWVARDANFDARGNEHMIRRQDYRWGPGRTILIAEVYDLTAEGARRPIVTQYYIWDAKEQNVRVFGIEPGGLFLDGYMRPLGSNGWRYVFEGTFPNGETFRSMEETRFEEGRMIVVGYIDDGNGGWTSPSPESVWTPVKNKNGSQKAAD